MSDAMETDTKKRKADETLEQEPAAKKAKTEETQTEVQQSAPSDVPEDPGERAKIAQLIREQIEYYLSDSNYPFDKFFLEQARLNNGYIPLETFAKCARVSRFTKNVDFIREAMKPSTVIEWNEDETKIKRKAPIPSADAYNARCILISGLPTDKENFNFEMVKSFFNEQFGGVVSVKLQKDKSKKLRGTALVEFETPEKAQEVAAKKEVTWDGRVITMGMKTEVEQQEKAKRKAKKEAEEAERKAKAAELERKENEAKIVRKAIVVLTNVPETPVEQRRSVADKIKASFESVAPAAFVDFVDTAKVYVRFKEADAEKALEALKAKSVKLGDVELEGYMLEGDDETNYWLEHILVGKKKAKGKGGKKSKRGKGKGKKAEDDE